MNEPTPTVLSVRLGLRLPREELLARWASRGAGQAILAEYEETLDDEVQIRIVTLAGPLPGPGILGSGRLIVDVASYESEDVSDAIVAEDAMIRWHIAYRRCARRLARAKSR